MQERLFYLDGSISSEGVGQAEGVRSSLHVGQPVVIDALEGVGHAVDWIEQVACAEMDRKVVAQAL